MIRVCRSQLATCEAENPYLPDAPSGVIELLESIIRVNRIILQDQHFELWIIDRGGQWAPREYDDRVNSCICQALSQDFSANEAGCPNEYEFHCDRLDAEKAGFCMILKDGESMSATIDL